MKICKVKGCENKHLAKGYCRKHYMQIRVYGKILKRTKFDKNEIIDCGDYCEICLYKKNIEIARTKIDKEDLEKIKDYKWHLDNCGYIQNSKNILLHQLILGKKKGFEIDHRNTNKLDNRKQNLRYATRSQNSMNKESKGYFFDENRNKWKPTICVNFKDIYLGYFNTEQQAQFARKKAEQKYFGKFAYKQY